MEVGWQSQVPRRVEANNVNRSKNVDPRKLWLDDKGINDKVEVGWFAE